MSDLSDIWEGITKGILTKLAEWALFFVDLLHK